MTVRRLVLSLAELDQHSAGGFRVEEGDSVSVRACSRAFVDEADALRFQLREDCFEVFHTIRGVVQLRCRIAAIACDRRIRIKRAKELDNRIAGSEPDCFHALILNHVAINLRETERLRVEFERRVEIANDDRDVIDLPLAAHATPSFAR